MAFTQGNLRHHLHVHYDKKPHVCHICSKDFSQNGHLKRHLLIHMNEKLYVCEVCRKGFSQNTFKGKSNLEFSTSRLLGFLERGDCKLISYLHDFV
ncbi:UNVERIFIED_CONTAM: Zbtb49 [Trichonephila clavipes]